MTTALARTATPLRTSPRPSAKAAPRKATPLKLVPSARSTAARTPFVVVVVTLLVSGLLGLLLLNMVVAQGSFQLHALAKQGKDLDLHEQQLANRVQALQAPGVLAQRATALGMVPGGPPAFLELPSGKVLGQPTAGVAPAPVVTAPPATTGTTTKAAAKPTTRPTGTTAP
ncbi:MAG: Septum formation initiator [Frankiales bacterium]|nr:Septum formation initiator [Frankiales bacterium]